MRKLMIAVAVIAVLGGLTDITGISPLPELTIRGFHGGLVSHSRGELGVLQLFAALGCATLAFIPTRRKLDRWDLALKQLVARGK